MIIRRVDALSVGKVLGCLYFLLGLIVGGFITLFTMLGAAAAGPRRGGLPDVIFGVGAVIVIPVFYGVVGLIGGLISGTLYNVVASVVGGIEIELQRRPDVRPEYERPESPS
jgi:hypothetical protein